NMSANAAFIPRDSGYPNGIAAARKALELDPDLAQAHAALAVAAWQYRRDWAGADAEFRRALELQPGLAETHHFYAMYLSALGRDSAALAEIRRALELDPLAPRTNTNYGDLLRSAGRESEAIQKLQKSAAIDPRQSSRSLVMT